MPASVLTQWVGGFYQDLRTPLYYLPSESANMPEIMSI